jgi:hypothetical protein
LKWRKPTVTLHKENFDSVKQLIVEPSHETLQIPIDVRVQISINAARLSSFYQLDALHDTRTDRYLTETKLLACDFGNHLFVVWKRI